VWEGFQKGFMLAHGKNAGGEKKKVASLKGLGKEGPFTLIYGGGRKAFSRRRDWAERRKAPPKAQKAGKPVSENVPR